MTNFKETERFGRLYTGGKVEAHGGSEGFVVCICGSEVNVIGLATGKVLLTVPAAADEFSAFTLRPDGRQIITAGRSRQFRSWDLEFADSGAATELPSGCECARVWKGHKLPVADLTFESTGTL